MKLYVLNRIEDTIMFNPLNRANIEEIVKIHLDNLVDKLKEKITYKVTTEKYKQLCLGYRGLALNSFNMENNQYGFEYSKIWNSYSKILDDTANILKFMRLLIYFHFFYRTRLGPVGFGEVRCRLPYKYLVTNWDFFSYIYIFTHAYMHRIS